MIWVWSGGEDEAGSRSSLSSRDSRAAQQAGSTRHTRRQGLLLCGLSVCVCVCVCVCKRVGEKGNRTQDGGSRRGKSCDGRATLYYENRTNSPRVASKESRNRARQGKVRQIWFRPDGTGCTCVCTNQRQRRSGGSKCPNVASASRSHSLTQSPTPLTHSSRPCSAGAGAAGWRVGTCWLPVGAGGIGTLGGRSGRGSLRRYIFERFEMGQMGYLGAQILQSLYPGPRQALGP